MNIIEELWYGNISPCERDFKKGSKYSELLGYRRAESCIYECGQVHRRCKQVHGSEGTDSRGAQSLYSQSSDPRA